MENAILVKELRLSVACEFFCPHTSLIKNIVEYGVKIMIPAASAFRIALEDPQTISFIRANFPSPEKYPQISSRRWLSTDNSGSRWNIELLEKKLFSFQKKVDLINVVLLEVDAASGKITGRTYFSNILMSEYRIYLARFSGNAVSIMS